MAVHAPARLGAAGTRAAGGIMSGFALAPSPFAPAKAEPIRAAAPLDAAASGARFTVNVLTAMLWLSVLTQKIAFGSNIELPLIVLGGGIALLVARGRAFISLSRLIVFVALAGAIAVEQALFAANRSASLPAMLVALFLYSAFVFVVPIERPQILLVLRRFQHVALFIAAMAGVDWAFQLTGRPMPSFETFVPADALYQAYNYIQPLHWQAAYMKPNGFFMLEASHTSQLLAMGLVLEICLFRRWRYVVAFIIAQLASFGGTGFVLLLASLVFVVPFYLRGRTLALLGLLLVVAAAGASQTPVWHNFATRSAEFGTKHSSGHGRMVEPYLFMVDRIANNRRTMVSGMGPGNGKLDTERTSELVINPISKAVVEYGLFAGVIWMVLLHLTVLRTRAPGVAAFVVLVQYDFLNGALIVPIHLVYCYVLAAAYSRARRWEPGDENAGEDPQARPAWR